ncbi:hypothetical protein BDN72DRAFT_906687 [Pluteus cervinus]|uniref:Uncharacterized protein n=1 Tax=Pluteus cervinus TaxID=181527 RepID=A0ACD2ZYP8_9AGAR|nr:hypothetical protein BDN72DRAFT_906687 [Pluteus cervinus]
MDPEDRDLGQNYWKGKILQFYKDKTKNETWATIHWLYNFVDLEAINIITDDMSPQVPFAMGKYELLMSNHVGVIGAGGIEGHLDVIELDDSKAISPKIHPSAWFRRWTMEIQKDGKSFKVHDLKPTCICHMLYSPRFDRQRLCTKCMIWYHEQCLQRVSTPQPPSEDEEESQLLGVPVVRGLWGKEDEWGVVGWADKVALMRRWFWELGSFPDDYSTVLGEDWIEHVLSREWAFYICPNCRNAC